MIKTWVLALASGLALVGCQADHAAAGPLGFDLNEVFPLRGGQEATINGEGRFDAVLEDSRCPKRVECVWTGQARIAIRVHDHGDPTAVEFNTHPAPGQNLQRVRVGEHTVALWSLDPYPDDVHQSIALEDYRATLLVQNA